MNVRVAVARPALSRLSLPVVAADAVPGRRSTKTQRKGRRHRHARPDRFASVVYWLRGLILTLTEMSARVGPTPLGILGSRDCRSRGA